MRSGWTSTAGSETGRRLIDASWSLDAIAAAYRDFLKTFAPLEGWIGTAAAPSPDDAMLARVLLIHHYRRVLLRDPLLPEALLPPDWPAREAREFCGRVYRALLPGLRAMARSLRRKRRRRAAAAGTGTECPVPGLICYENDLHSEFSVIYLKTI